VPRRSVADGFGGRSGTLRRARIMAITSCSRRRCISFVLAADEVDDRVRTLVALINDTARCPIVVILDDEDPAVITEAPERGLDAYATSSTPEALESAIALARKRFDEIEALGHHVRDLEGGATRRALIEQAKGVLMERYGIDERSADERLRQHARSRRITLH